MEEQKGMMTFKYEVTQNDFIRAGEASSDIKRILKRLGIGAPVIRKTAIATYEAEMNIVIHSRGGQLELIITKEAIEVVAKDQGPGIADVELAMQEGYSTAPQEVRELGFGAGMGLPNMKRCTDGFKVDSTLGEGTKVVMRFLIS